MLTVVAGIMCIFLLPNSPATTSFLTANERKLLVKRLENDSGGSGTFQVAIKIQQEVLVCSIVRLENLAVSACLLGKFNMHIRVSVGD
jgi:hypothetical protein